MGNKYISDSYDTEDTLGELQDTAQKIKSGVDEAKKIAKEIKKAQQGSDTPQSGDTSQSGNTPQSQPSPDTSNLNNANQASGGADTAAKGTETASKAGDAAARGAEATAAAQEAAEAATAAGASSAEASAAAAEAGVAVATAGAEAAETSASAAAAAGTAAASASSGPAAPVVAVAGAAVTAVAEIADSAGTLIKDFGNKQGDAKDELKVMKALAIMVPVILAIILVLVVLIVTFIMLFSPLWPILVMIGEIFAIKFAIDGASNSLFPDDVVEQPSYANIAEMILNDYNDAFQYAYDNLLRQDVEDAISEYGWDHDLTIQSFESCPYPYIESGDNCNINYLELYLPASSFYEKEQLDSSTFTYEELKKTLKDEGYLKCLYSYSIEEVEEEIVISSETVTETMTDRNGNTRTYNRVVEEKELVRYGKVTTGTYNMLKIYEYLGIDPYEKADRTLYSGYTYYELLKQNIGLVRGFSKDAFWGKSELSSLVPVDNVVNGTTGNINSGRVSQVQNIFGQGVVKLGITHFKQSDPQWGNLPLKYYSRTDKSGKKTYDTMTSAGCCVTAFSMVANYADGHSTPKDVITWINSSPGTNGSRSAWASHYGCNLVSQNNAAFNVNEIINHLNQGHAVTLRFGGRGNSLQPSWFNGSGTYPRTKSTTQHHIVIKGFNTNTSEPVLYFDDPAVDGQYAQGEMPISWAVAHSSELAYTAYKVPTPGYDEEWVNSNKPGPGFGKTDGMKYVIIGDSRVYGLVNHLGVDSRTQKLYNVTKSVEIAPGIAWTCFNVGDTIKACCCGGATVYMTDDWKDWILSECPASDYDIIWQIGISECWESSNLNAGINKTKEQINYFKEKGYTVHFVKIFPVANQFPNASIVNSRINTFNSSIGAYTNGEYIKLSGFTPIYNINAQPYPDYVHLTNDNSENYLKYLKAILEGAGGSVPY